MRNLIVSVLSLLILSVISLSQASANEFGVNIYGKSYHFITDNRSRNRLNEFNPGIGFRATFGEAKSSNFIIEGGRFRDTFENTAKYLSIGFLIKIFQGFKIGLNGAVYSTNSTNRGEAFFAPLPMASYTLGPVTVNSVFLPKFNNINPYNTLGFYLTMRLFKGSPKKKKN